MSVTREALFVIAPERFRDEELEVPRRALLAAGFRVTVASTRPGIAFGMNGAKERVGVSVSAAAAGTYAAIVVVGGDGAPDHLWSHEPLLGLIRRQHAAQLPLASICLAGAVLARAGVLSGKRATVFADRSATIELKRGGATFVDEPVVLDGTILTASGPEAAAAFGSALVKLLDQ